MKLNRIFSIVLRNLYTFRTNYDRMFDAFYWPILDLLLWGLTSAYFSRLSPDFSKMLVMIVSGLTFWLIVPRSQYETNVSLLEDSWSKNLINLFVSPLKFYEWIVGVLTIGVIKSLMSFTVATIFAFILYEVNIFMYGIYLLPFIFLLMMTGWTVSFFIAGLIFRFGSRVQSFAWTLVFLLAPVSGIYYPISSLPQWVQGLSLFVPTSYIFEGMRQVIIEGTVDTNKLVVSLLLNIFYLILSFAFLRKCYNSLLNRGLLKMF